MNRLLQHKANVIGEKGGFQDPLSCVAAWGKSEVQAMVQLLISNGAYVDLVTNYDNENALMHAVYRGNLDIVKKIC